MFRFDPEMVHNFTFFLLKNLPLTLARVLFPKPIKNKRLEREVFGLTFKNPVGLAAGLDKNAKLFKEFSSLGFGFVEIGTLTPKPQPGNEQKRLFRLIEDSGIINRMGFNNEGVDAAVKRLKKNKEVLIGGNIGKNKNTPNEQAIDDYETCFKKLFLYVDYFVVNVSSPNTPNLRELQEKEPLTRLLQSLQQLNIENEKPKPILLKIAPDLSDDQLMDIIEIIKETKIAGVIATNTTLSREGLKSKTKIESGGLSGKPLNKRSTLEIKLILYKSISDPIVDFHNMSCQCSDTHGFLMRFPGQVSI